jgi:hypothetical protein
MPFACDLLPIQLMHGDTQAAALMAKWSNACSLRLCYRDIDSIFDVSGQRNCQILVLIMRLSLAFVNGRLH